jgi:hypothetical protein
MSDPIQLHVQAERCFRLARGSAGPKLAEELEALGRAFRQKARELEASRVSLTLTHRRHTAQGTPTLSPHT